ncbi:hypothetical protein [Chelatococcus asaccharovorans]|uniref:Uncharacterized protein n=1 Tax=Chelatococcus asaccharovorans TaxID=28210 RepID=A0A2V3UI88_9HYPH|nr:hypothetical protein [Chelatococcus asaccharovorans]MBS7701757.1 hypothetical protein [Chelatococcus asaccharovorans]PXW64537.1 hypothetical protein C7450_101292 [Chelatococcus asaccharovorans]CAH1665267.1 conserved hypothetical protein [Chelatococcus asaccharovorans]CAH1682034.1 conserved hypothetical protein [Chelatococcus asaccharovorans]
MKIDSAAGEFAFDISNLELRDGGIVLTGKMGVWEAETTMTDADLRRLVRLVLLKPGAWGYLFRMILGARTEAKAEAAR